LHEIDDNNQLLFHNKDGIERSKRSLLNVISNVANKLFAVLDDGYARKIEKTIEKIKND
jgi:hypothetical protein